MDQFQLHSSRCNLSFRILINPDISTSWNVVNIAWKRDRNEKNDNLKVVFFAHSRDGLVL